MRVIPLSSDSMGARSMATFIETKDAKIMIDPSVALGPSRYGLPPHPREWKRMQEHWKGIVNYAEKADILIITHYHYDHHNPWDNLEIYEGKKVLIKDPKKNINYSQKSRASFFLKQLENRAKIEIADGNKVSEGETEILFSNPVFHGTNDRLGYVVEVLIREGDNSFLFTSDVEGPSLEDQVKFVLENRPKIVMIDGPMTYMLGYRYSQVSLEASIQNLLRILDVVETLVIDHHLLRDLDWNKRIAKVLDKGNTMGKKVLTSNELVDKPLDMLEARRKELYELYPVKESEMRRWSFEE